MFEMVDTGLSISEFEIVRLEQKCKVKLPVEYRNFLLKNNGGHCKPAFFPIYGLKDNPIGHIQLFYGVNHQIESCRPDWNYEVFRRRMPIGFFPIACEDGGNIICISLLDDSIGGVFYWLHDAEEGSPALKNIYKIADSFQAFLDSIHDVDIATL